MIPLDDDARPRCTLATQKVNESQIARELRVSRSPVREALHQLEEQGLIENVERRGMFAVLLTDEDVEKITSVRVILEAEALRLARARRTPESERKLESLVDRLESTAPASPYEMSRLDLEFHRAIWSFAGNEYLEKMLSRLIAPLFAHSAIAFTKAKKETRMVLDSHRPLLEYIRGNSSEPSAEEAIIRHTAVWRNAVKYSSLAVNESDRHQGRVA